MAADDLEAGVVGMVVRTDRKGYYCRVVACEEVFALLFEGP